MSKMYYGSIDLSKIDKKKLFEGKKGVYADVIVWVNDDADQYGNKLSIQQSTTKEEEKIYLVNCKEYVKKEGATEQPKQWDEETSTKDLPF